MEDNLTMTIDLKEYRDLVSTHNKFELLTDLLVSSMEIGWDGKPTVNGRKAAEYLEFFTPLSFQFKRDELEKNNDKEK